MRNPLEAKPATRGIVAILGCFQLPLELDRVHLFSREREDTLRFRFGYREIPFVCVAERQDGVPCLTLTGDLGALPYTAEGPHRRRSVQMIIAAASRDSGLGWTVSPRQQIEVKGELAIDRPLTPTALVAGTVTLVLRARPYLDLLLETLTSAEAA
ncbi:MAG TPA: hypothetical protein VLX09_12215 [Stellaceae bacterium]|nr:hypothetical protein [Stellaceae bacterium]